MKSNLSGYIKNFPAHGCGSQLDQLQLKLAKLQNKVFIVLEQVKSQRLYHAYSVFSAILIDIMQMPSCGFQNKTFAVAQFSGQ